MKIYISGKFERKDEILKLYERVRKLGHEISYDWTTHKDMSPWIQNPEMALGYSNNEINGILNCDVFIFIADEKGTTMLMELGAAIALQKKTGKPAVYAVGRFTERSPWFFNDAVKRKSSVDEVLDEIGKI